MIYSLVGFLLIIAGLMIGNYGLDKENQFLVLVVGPLLFVPGLYLLAPFK